MKLSNSNKLPISVIIPVLNEEKNLVDCIRSVAWAAAASAV